MAPIKKKHEKTVNCSLLTVNSFAVALTLSFVILVALWPRGEWLGLGMLAAVLVGAGCGLGARWGRLLRQMARMEIFVLGVAALAVFQPGGVWLALNMLVKAHVCVGAMLLLGQFVSFGAFLGVLKGWGCRRCCCCRWR